MKIHFSLFAALGIAVLPGIALSEDQQELPTLVVTSTRTPLAAEDFPAAVTVYTRADIERQQVRTLPELLQGSIGLGLTQSGQFGKTTSVFLRGTGSDQVLVLINGIRVGSATLGTAAFQFLPIEQIERVEIVRGPHSSIYGSEAIGGVIQIFTHKGRGEPHVSGKLGGGSFETFDASGTANGEYHDTDFNLTAAYFDTDGYDIRQPTLGPFGVDQPDDDGYDNTSVSARLGHRFDNGLALDTFLVRAWGESEFDDSSTDRTDFLQQVAGGSASYSPMDFWRATLRAGQSRDDSDNFAPNGDFFSRFDTTRWEMSLQNDLSITAEHLVSLGADYRNEDIDSSEDFAETSRYNVGVFGQYIGKLGRNDIVGSVRWDDNEAFGSETTGSVGWSYRWNYGIRLLATFGTAFKAPSFNELFFPEFGNPDLNAETSTSYEVGLEGEHSWGGWGLRAFRTDIDDLIVTVFDPVTFEFFPDNVDKARIDGLEAQAHALLWGWDASLEITLLDPENRGTGNRLPRRSEEALSFDLSRQLGKLNIGATVLAQGDRFDDAGNTTRVSGYAVVDLRGEYAISEGWYLQAKVANLLDKDYETVSTFNEADRNFFIALQYRPQ